MNFNECLKSVPFLSSLHKHMMSQTIRSRIILEAAFSLYDRTFTDNIGSVLIFAVLGTIFACFLIAFPLDFQFIWIIIGWCYGKS
ncbi:hypothetical protein KUTeg_012009 [Tegillarca granosa]|uniref:Uncharacterized protein n=1 Tax=Tegillarca granosa TaxID=220873 RepID=A0ABQ9EYA2_TEGGR|nr:hypothetical protein KUTeg_012009 [Tegillarca granosa]